MVAPNTQGFSPRVAFILGAICVSAIIALVAFGFFHRNGDFGLPGAGSGSTPSVTRFPAPKGMVAVPPDAKGVPENVAVPLTLTPSNPYGTAELRTFTVRAENGVFMPNTITVRLNDLTEVHVAAVDGDYDLIQPDFGITELIPQGETKTIALSPSGVGKFVFYCSHCGPRASGATGFLIVLPR